MRIPLLVGCLGLTYLYLPESLAILGGQPPQVTQVSQATQTFQPPRTALVVPTEPNLTGSPPGGPGVRPDPGARDDYRAGQ